MIQKLRIATLLFSIGMIGMGMLSVLSRDFAFGWQPVPAFHPGRELLAVICGIFMIATSVALLFRATSAIAARAMFPFLLAWFGLKIPSVIVAPQIEGVWLGTGEIGMLLAGGWVLFACFSELGQTGFFSRITGRNGIRISRILFGLAVIPVGLGHIFYADITAHLVPAWLPFRVALAYLTGFGQIGCGLAILFSVFPRAAAMIETVMLALFAFLVWGPDTWFASTPKLAGSPSGPRFALTAFFITWVIGAAALLIADSCSPRFDSSTENRR
jgi:uncharacterized membrane protein